MFFFHQVTALENELSQALCELPAPLPRESTEHLRAELEHLRKDNVALKEGKAEVDKLMQESAQALEQEAKVSVLWQTRCEAHQRNIEELTAALNQVSTPQNDPNPPSLATFSARALRALLWWHHSTLVRHSEFVMCFFLLTPMHKPAECYGEAGGKTFLDSTPATLPSRFAVDGTSIVTGDP